MELLDADEASVREYIFCLAVKLLKDAGAVNPTQRTFITSGQLTSACVVASLMTGIPARVIENEARENAAKLIRDGGDWRRQMELLKSYNRAVGYDF